MIFNVGKGGASTAEAVQYDNSLSGLEADNVQGALDEVTDSLNNRSEITERITLATSSGTLTMPDDGWVQLQCSTNTNASIKMNDIPICAAATTANNSCYLPPFYVKKGQIIDFTVNAGTATCYFVK